MIAAKVGVLVILGDNIRWNPPRVQEGRGCTPHGAENDSPPQKLVELRILLLPSLVCKSYGAAIIIAGSVSTDSKIDHQL